MVGSKGFSSCPEGTQATLVKPGPLTSKACVRAPGAVRKTQTSEAITVICCKYNLNEVVYWLLSSSSCLSMEKVAEWDPSSESDPRAKKILSQVADLCAAFWMHSECYIHEIVSASFLLEGRHSFVARGLSWKAWDASHHPLTLYISF